MYVVGTQKNHLIETVLLSIENNCLNRWIRKQAQKYSHNICLAGPMKQTTKRTSTSIDVAPATIICPENVICFLPLLHIFKCTKARFFQEIKHLKKIQW